MGGLIDNVLDLARSRLGGGLRLDRSVDAPLGPALEQVVNELRSGWPDRRIDLAIDLPRPINCDPVRMAQLLSNLLANALKHGADEPVSVRASVRDGMLSSCRSPIKAIAIPPEVIKRLFEPFYRPLNRREQSKAWDWVSTLLRRSRTHTAARSMSHPPEDETRFVFRMPAS